MAITTSYNWEQGSSLLLNDISSAGSQFGPAVAGNLAGDRYIAAWSDPNNRRAEPGEPPVAPRRDGCPA